MEPNDEYDFPGRPRVLRPASRFFPQCALAIYGIDMDLAERFSESLRKHILYVREAGDDLGVDVMLLYHHDESKWSLAEFPAYAQHFHGDKRATMKMFAAAWLHHIHANPHHPEHWIFPDGWSPDGSELENGVMEMPKKYALEMVADWMGASMAYTKSWEMDEWLKANMPEIRVHSATAAYLREVLDFQGYADIVYATRFGSEEENQDGNQSPR